MDLKAILKCLIEIFINPAVLAIGSILLTYKIGFFGFRRQRVRDELTKTYVEGGIKSLIDHILANLNILESNYANSLFLLKEYRDNDGEHFNTICEPKINELLILADPSIPVSFYRTLPLIGNIELQELLYNTFTEFKSNNNIYMTELPNSIRKHINNPKSMEKKQLLEGLANILNEFRTEIHYVYSLVELLERLHFRLRRIDMYKYEQISSLLNDRYIKSELDRIPNIKKQRDEAREKTTLRNTKTDAG